MSHKGFLSAEIFSWNADIQSTTEPDDEWKSAYPYWAHAERLLQHQEQNHYLIDCIANLNRAIDHRLKRLSVLYQLKRLPKMNQPGDLLGLLGYLEVARPLMLHQINDLRNLLEHQYKSAPDLERCRELVELTWYFLKSTDILSKSVVSEFILRESDPIEEIYWLEVAYSPDKKWEAAIRGWIPISFWNMEAESSLLIEVEDVRFHDYQKEKKKKVFPDFGGPEHTENDIYIVGKVLGGACVFETLTKLYFSLQ